MNEPVLNERRGSVHWITLNRPERRNALTGQKERIDAIRDAYKESFSQQSVLRVDDPDPVRVGF